MSENMSKWCLNGCAVLLIALMTFSAIATAFTFAEILSNHDNQTSVNNATSQPIARHSTALNTSTAHYVAPSQNVGKSKTMAEQTNTNIDAPNIATHSNQPYKFRLVSTVNIKKEVHTLKINGKTKSRKVKQIKKVEHKIHVSRRIL